MRWTARLWLCLGLIAAPLFALCLAAALTPLPAALKEHAPAMSVRVVDRNGRIIREFRTSGGELGAPVALEDLHGSVTNAILAAEDARFYRHPGVDPLAVVRAAGQLIWHRRIVSGASTLTQQLARTVVHRPRTFAGKLREMALALRIEASLDKDRILEEYLSRVEFGPNVRGIEAASHFYLDKPASKLSLAEAAMLAAIPRGPTLYDPRRGTDKVRARRDRILDRMLARGLAERDAVERARAEPIRLQRTLVEGGGHHLAVALASGAAEPTLRGKSLNSIVSTLDLGLQREIEELARRSVARLEQYDVSAAAVLVIDNGTSEVIAYVGSPDFLSDRALGQNDGARALRQPGSTLKPFVYAAAMETLGLTPASLLPDLELHLPTEHGDYSPKNYDRKYHGPVRLREALASSLNVPAAYVASRVGAETVLARLRRLGFASLDKDAAHYGAGLALGDGEVRLTELAAAYAAVARGGLYRPLRFARRAALANGEKIEIPAPPERRVLDARLAALVTDILADDAARLSGFGRGSDLELPFPAAVKTGTSKGYRDNWTVGFTRELTVAVWVGNFDGHPMRGTSGVTGAAPLFRAAMLAAHRARATAPLFDASGLVALDICPLSGELAGPDCPHRMRETFVADRRPSHHCSIHVRVPVDPHNGLRAGPACHDAVERVFEHHSATYTPWATSAGRPLPPTSFSPRCPGTVNAGSEPLAVTFPFDAAEFVADAGIADEQQQIALRARAPAGVPRLAFLVDGKLVAHARAPFVAPWSLEPGEHVLWVEAAGRKSEKVRFSVR